MNLTVVANNTQHFNELNTLNIETIVLSSTYSSYRKGFTVEEIETCFEINNNIAVSLYDLISESKIDEVTKYIDKLIEIGIKTFFVNDSGLVYYLQKYDVKVILDNVTLNSNANSINMWKKFGVNGVVCGREITIDEINGICDKCDMDIYVHVQGSFPIFTSIRKLLSNYKIARDVDCDLSKASLYDKERDSNYNFIESDNGVVMFSSYEQCSIEDLDKLHTLNFIIDQPNVCDDINISIVKMYLDYTNYSMESIQGISELKQSRGFFYKRTLYKL